MSLAAVYIDPAISSISPPETPFQRYGRCTQARWFIYMTNRSKGRWSCLMTEADTRKRFEAYLHMGYTQLWLLHKIYTSGPASGESAPDENGRRRTFHPSPPGHLDRRDWPGRLFVILREPIAVAFPTGDVIGYRVREETAVRRAQKYTETYGRRAVVGLMARDVAWH